MITHRVEIDDLHTHHFRVTLTLPRPSAEVEVALPVWIPGSYMVRDFARHLSLLQASQGRLACELTAIDKTRWRVRCAGRTALTLRYRVYAFDSSVRGAFLDAQRGFFNGSALLLRVAGREAEPQRLQLGALPAGWHLATAMPLAPGGAPLVFQAVDYDELVDHPFELGTFWRGEFSAGGVPHGLVVTGAWPRADMARLLADAQRVCEAVQAFWRGTSTGPSADPPVPAASRATARPGAGKAEEGQDASVKIEARDTGAEHAPFARYEVLLNLRESGGGGLEHRASTALLAARQDMPAQGVEPTGQGYPGLLGLICHEYFHAWHVKRLKPVDLAPIDYSREQHTSLLWCFEGFTSYFEDLLLCRAGLLSPAQALRGLARTVNAVLATPGRLVQSVAEASFDAWTKLYRADENTPNATVSYYAKGALVALALDLSLRQHGRSLDEVLHRLWRASGGGPVSEADIFAAVRAVAGPDLGAGLADALHTWVHGTVDLPLQPLLAAMGVAWQTEPADLARRCGLKLSEGPVTGVQVRQVLAGGAAALAGVAAGDELLAVDGWRIRRLDDARGWTASGQTAALLLVRDQRVHQLALRLPAASEAATVVLSLRDTPSRAELQRRRAWIGA